MKTQKETHRRLGVIWRRFRDRFGARSFMFSLILESSRKESRDRPVVSGTIPGTIDDSPFLVGPTEKKIDR